ALLTKTAHLWRAHLSHAIKAGLTEEALLGMARNRDPFDARDRATLLSGGAVVVAEYRFHDADGRVHIMRSAVRPRVEHDCVVGVTGISIDVTAQRDTEEQLRAAQKMEAVGRLAGGVAHDFNNLLSVILSYTELALLDLRQEDPLRADLDEISQAAKRAAGLTRQLLAFSRRQLLQPEPLDLNELVSSLANMLRRLIGEDVELRVSAGTSVFETKADRGQIEQVLLNLVVNARDAMPDGGRVTLSTSNVWLDEHRASATDVPPGAYVELTVQDTGFGMDATTRERIFEPFFTTKGVGKGTGLGLSMVYGIVRQSGGGIFVESEPASGATFRIYLPRHEADEPAPSVTGYASRTVRGNESILVVEDEAALRNVVRRTLTSVGYRVIVAANAAEALDVCSQRPDQVQLVLTDVVMPGMSGRELAERLVTLCPTIKVLFMSGYTDEAIARHGVLGPGFLRKPFDRRTLTDCVRRTLDER
ncbi:MAG: ATP-binding protein, partial [Polyangiales bacterium]